MPKLHGRSMLAKFKRLMSIGICIFAVGCGDESLNNPYPNANGESDTLYTSFSERPKHLDPARSYSSNEWIITNQVYEPPLQYHYLKRPYTLEPLVATQMPVVRYFNQQGAEIADVDKQAIAYSTYTIQIKPNIRFQPHPAFAKNKKTGEFLYHHLSEEQAEEYGTPLDFEVQDSRVLTAEDFVYQIKRLADPKLNSPIFGFMSEYIIGFDELRKKLDHKSGWVDLRQFDLSGVKAIDDTTYEIKIKGHYPQLLYWLAMPFFAPMPWEVTQFYAQDVLIEQNLTLDWYPVGTGPYILADNNPNLQILLQRNPNYHGEQYPIDSMPEDKAMGLSDLAGKQLPFLDEIRFILEKESIPYWNKFLQGYYDQSGISSDSFDQALQANTMGSFDLSHALKGKGIKLSTSVVPSTYYWGFNMLDDVVGGLSEDHKKLRQAISIVFDVEEYINIFQNGRGFVAQSPLPPGIFGFQNNKYNHTIYETQSTRKNIDAAKKLLAEAGFADGIDPKTGKPLVLHLDAVVGGGPDTHALYAWIRKQFKKLGIELVVRATQYNRFQDKMRNGDAQIFSWGWNADYPDPENFLFLLYGPNGKTKTGGENAANYDNPKFNTLFDKAKSMPNNTERLQLLDEMIQILQEDAPWIWGYHPKLYSLSHEWMGPFKANAMSRNTLKYISIDTKQRATQRTAWNHAIFWPIWLGLGLFMLALVPAGIRYWQKTHKPLKLKCNDNQEQEE